MGAETTRGYANYQNNEDSFDIFAVRSQAGPITFAVVADGIAGIRGGGFASQIAVDAIVQSLSEDAPSIRNPHTLDAALNTAIQRANNQVLEKSLQLPNHQKIGTTVALVAIAWGQLQIAYLGDSRIYLLRKGALHRLTLDHSWVQEALDKEEITEPELHKHPNRNVISRYLGSKYNIDLEIDRRILLPGYYQQDYLDREFRQRLPIEDGDSLLLCSDGLTSSLTDREVKQLLIQHHTHPQHAASNLVKSALKRYVRDNTTVVVLSTILSRPAYPQMAKISKFFVSLLSVPLFSVICFLFGLFPQFILPQILLSPQGTDSPSPMQEQYGSQLKGPTPQQPTLIIRSTPPAADESPINPTFDTLGVVAPPSILQSAKPESVMGGSISRLLLNQFEEYSRYQVFLFEPINKMIVGEEIVKFRWRTHPPIETNVSGGLTFDIVVWPAELDQNWESGKSLLDIQMRQPTVNSQNQWELVLSIDDALRPGKYNWTVVVVYKNPYTRIAPIGTEIGTFTFVK
ncbi:MAG: protein phosphatase 2C domain-containing protein [Chloroflexota bacterium]